jgi:hypothetical protein
MYLHTKGLKIYELSAKYVLAQNVHSSQIL